MRAHGDTLEVLDRQRRIDGRDLGPDQRGAGGDWRRLRYRRTGRFVPTGAATMANGDVLVLERRFTWIGGLASRIVRLRGDRIRAGAALVGTEVATIDPPLTVENYEGIAVRPLSRGGAYVYLVSDDNFHSIQRTLLLMFEYRF